MPISHTKELIFVHVPKNAGTAITNSCDFTDIGHHFYSYYQDKYPQQWAKYYKFAIIRNSWDRTVSNYEYAKMAESYWHTKGHMHPDYDAIKDKTFEETVDLLCAKSLKHPGWLSQHPYVYDSNRNLMVNRLFNYESFRNHFPDLKIINNSQEGPGHRDWRKYYDENTKSKIASIYREDIKLFDFKF